MTFAEKLKEVQNFLQAEGYSGWLLYDFRRSNPFLYTFLSIPDDKMLTRRFCYWIPQSGEPLKIVPLIEPHTLDHLPGIKSLYRTWQDFEAVLHSFATKNAKILMEYSPFNSLPVVSKVDAGTVELVEKRGAQVISSANILQKYTNVWTEDQLSSHLRAAEVLEHIVDLTWDYISLSIQKKEIIDEYVVQQFMYREILKRGCISDHAPICAVNANSADPHYSPPEKGSHVIAENDFILLDLWCKEDKNRAVYADIARVGVVSREPTQKQKDVFKIVKTAREKALDFISQAYEKGKAIQGWEVDQVCRNYIDSCGYGDFFIHRTGHNIGETVHGSGANLDDFETHDFRFLIPGTCFSVEPGIYLPDEFGVRLEYDVYLDLANKVLVTGGIQEEITLLKA